LPPQFGENEGFFGQETHSVTPNVAQNNVGQKRHQKIFHPVTLSMVQASASGPNDTCEIDGAEFNDVSNNYWF